MNTTSIDSSDLAFQCGTNARHLDNQLSDQAGTEEDEYEDFHPHSEFERPADFSERPESLERREGLSPMLVSMGLSTIAFFFGAFAPRSKYRIRQSQRQQ
jgi:hypothetical protein